MLPNRCNPQQSEEAPQQGGQQQSLARADSPTGGATFQPQAQQFMLNGCYGNVGTRTNFAIHEILGLASAATMPMPGQAVGTANSAALAGCFLPSSVYCQPGNGQPFLEQESSTTNGQQHGLFPGLELVPGMVDFGMDYASLAVGAGTGENGAILGPRKVETKVIHC